MTHKKLSEIKRELLIQNKEEIIGTVFEEMPSGWYLPYDVGFTTGFEVCEKEMKQRAQVLVDFLKELRKKAEYTIRYADGSKHSYYDEITKQCIDDILSEYKAGLE